MFEVRKKYYRLYRGSYSYYVKASNWDLYGVYKEVDKAWTALRETQTNREQGMLLPQRIVSVVPCPQDDADEFDPWSDDGDETFIDEKGCGLDEWTRLHVTGEIG